MKLTVDNINLLKQIIDTALTDSFYIILMTLDGDAQLGNNEQQVYKVICEDGSRTFNEEFLGDRHGAVS